MPRVRVGKAFLDYPHPAEVSALLFPTLEEVDRGHR